jgi:hypothetical protein
MAAMASRTWQISQATCTAETSTTEEISCHDTQAQAWMRAPMNWMISTCGVSDTVNLPRQVGARTIGFQLPRFGGYLSAEE